MNHHTPGHRGGRSAPSVSVVVACHDAEATLAETLESLCSQSHRDWEAVCIDDGSSDGTPEILANFARRDARIRWERLPHVGQPAAKNHGLDLSRAQRVLILDADDVARPDALATMLLADKYAEGRAIIAPGYELLDRRGHGLSLFRFTQIKHLRIDALLYGNCLPPMSLIPRELLGTKRFDEALRTSIDWDLWLRVAEIGAACLPVPRALFGYRLHGASLSHNADEMFASGRQVLNRWCPRASNGSTFGDACHRLAFAYGAIAAAAGTPRAIERYFAVLPPLEPKNESFLAFGHSVYSAFEFVRGADGRTWQTDGQAWLPEVAEWLRTGPLAPHADDTLAALRGALEQRLSGLERAREFVAAQPPTRRIVLYGVGQNGQTLLEHLRSDANLAELEFCVADDGVDRRTLALLDQPPSGRLAPGPLRREDPPRWENWPANTVVVVTPNNAGAMCAVLQRAGGREGIDFVRWTRVCEPALAGTG